MEFMVKATAWAAASGVLADAGTAWACGAFCPRDGASGLLSLGLFTAVGLIGAAWIFSGKTKERS
ncbi:MAG: hypothetical protein HYT87_14650 [Nitrospirae bacterium]|nr:hypothetical protein [Nitrospirota bacterium]